MKIKSMFLASSLLLISSAVLASNPSVQKPIYSAIHYIVNNETGAPIKYFYTNIVSDVSPTGIFTSLPIGTSNFNFTIPVPGWAMAPEVTFVVTNNGDSNGAYIDTQVNWNLPPGTIMNPTNVTRNICTDSAHLAVSCNGYATGSPTTYNVVVNITKKS